MLMQVTPEASDLTLHTTTNEHAGKIIPISASYSEDILLSLA